MSEQFKGLVAKEIMDGLAAIPHQLVDLSEAELKAQCRPSSIDYALKTSFWREYAKCEQSGGTFNARDVYGGITSVGYWRNHVLKNHFKLAWITRPAQVYEREVEALLYRGTERLWELMDMDIMNDDGFVDTRRGALLLETIKMVEQRAKGLAVQRVQALNVNVDANKPKKIEAVDIDARIRELEAQLRSLPEAIDVRSEDGILDAIGDEEAAT